MFRPSFRHVELNRSHPLARGLKGAWTLHDLANVSSSPVARNLVSRDGYNHATLGLSVNHGNGVPLFRAPSDRSYHFEDQSGDDARGSMRVVSPQGMDVERLTYAFWLKPLSATGSSIFAGRYPTAFFLYTASTNKLTFADLWRGLEPGEHGTALTLGKWHFVVGVTAPERSTIWINGIRGPVGTTNAANVWGPEPLLMGYNIIGDYLDGEIALFMAWNRALNDKECLDLYAEQWRRTLFRRLPKESIPSIFYFNPSRFALRTVDPTVQLITPGGITPDVARFRLRAVDPAVQTGVLVVTPTPTIFVLDTADPTVSIDTLGPNARVTRLAIEVAARRLALVRPLTLPSVHPALLLHNWNQPVQITTTYLTDVVDSSATVSEERRGLLGRPFRTVTAELSGLSRAAAAKLLLGLARRGAARSLFPLYSDFSRITASSSGTTVLCDTRWRRFFVGQRVAVCLMTTGGVSSHEVRQVLSRADDRLELTSGLAGTYPAGSRVYPLIDAELSLDAAQGTVTDEVASANFTATEVAGPSSLPQTTWDTPHELTTRNGIPILDLALDWGGEIESRIVRSGTLYARGRSEVVFARGARPQLEHELRFTELTRERLWLLLRLFDSLRGRQLTFYALTPQTLFKFSAVSGTSLDVLPDPGNLADVTSFLDHVVVRQRNGTILLRKILSVVDMTTFWRVTVDEALPTLVAADVRAVTGAHLVRLTEDGMTEEWITDEACSVTLPARDVLEEKDVVIVNLAPQKPAPVPQRINDLYLWLDAGSRNLWAYQNQTAPLGFERDHRPALLDPGLSGDKISHWEDARLIDPTEAPQARLDATANAALPHALPRLYRDRSPSFANGRKVVTVADAAELGLWRLKPSGPDFFSNQKGLTIFAVLRKNAFTPPGATPNVNSAEGTGILYRAGVIYLWTNHARLYETLGGGAQDITYPTIDDKGFLIYVLTWKPATYGKVWFNGGTPKGTLSSQINDLPTDTVADGTRILNLKGDTSPNPTDWHLRQAFASLLIYRRALNDTEINTIGAHLGKAHGLPWSPLA
jgi:hypothetical protein